MEVSRGTLPGSRKIDPTTRAVLEACTTSSSVSAYLRGASANEPKVAEFHLRRNGKKREAGAKRGRSEKRHHRRMKLGEKKKRKKKEKKKKPANDRRSGQEC